MEFEAGWNRMLYLIIHNSIDSSHSGSTTSSIVSRCIEFAIDVIIIFYNRELRSGYFPQWWALNSLRIWRTKCDCWCVLLLSVSGWVYVCEYVYDVGVCQTHKLNTNRGQPANNIFQNRWRLIVGVGTRVFRRRIMSACVYALCCPVAPYHRPIYTRSTHGTRPIHTHGRERACKYAWRRGWLTYAHLYMRNGYAWRLIADTKQPERIIYDAGIWS